MSMEGTDKSLLLDTDRTPEQRFLHEIYFYSLRFEASPTEEFLSAPHQLMCPQSHEPYFLKIDPQRYEKQIHHEF